MDSAAKEAWSQRGRSRVLWGRIIRNSTISIGWNASPNVGQNDKQANKGRPVPLEVDNRVEEC
jgi:hypothetical protein